LLGITQADPQLLIKGVGNCESAVSTFRKMDFTGLCIRPRRLRKNALTLTKLPVLVPV
jgi:hypothetical protein